MNDETKRPTNLRANVMPTDGYVLTIDGKLTQITNDGYVHSDVDFSPDGKYVSYARTVGTGMIIAQRMTDGGPRDLFIRPVGGGGQRVA